MHSQDVDNLDYRKYIIIKNARQNNLRGISTAIPQGKLVVITGVSGSGKSSLAFDTLYAEGQRRYVESLSAYVRQFMGKLEKPQVDYIKGLSPAIAIQQKVNTSNPRSTVGTATEVYDYLRLLYARAGRTYSPVSGREVKRHTVGDVTNFIQSQPEGTRIQILCPIIRNPNRAWAEELSIILQKGFTRIELEDRISDISDIIPFVQDGADADTRRRTEIALEKAKLLIDRVAANAADDDTRARIADSVQTAFFEGHGDACIEIFSENGLKKGYSFSDRFELDGVSFEEPSVNLFTFNNPYGACKACEGFGQVIGIDEEKVIPNKMLSVYEGAVAPWKGEKMGEWLDDFIKKSIHFDFPIHRAYNELNAQEKKLLWNGNKKVNGIHDFFKYVESKTYKIQYRVMLARYKGRTRCMECGGSRLRPEAQYVKVANRSIGELVEMPLDELYRFFLEIDLNEFDRKVAERILREINNRLLFLNDVGLGYLTLNRTSRTLSGGESQRIQLVTSLGSNLTGSLYILDEPSIGLHSRDTQKLIAVLKRLRDLGNTVLVVEHDEDIMREADVIIDIGPKAGRLGGELVFQGTLKELLTDGQTLTANYLREDLKVPLPERRRMSNEHLVITGADKHNLKGIDVHIPLYTITVISGVSGSGKSTLVREVLYPELRKYIEKGDKKYRGDKLSGSLHKIDAVEYVDQNPIGKSSRSNPVTFVKAFDPMRELFAAQPLAKQRGYTAGFFSFNVDGGRCDVCKGEGIITIEMQFMADVEIECENCHGTRYRADLLEVEYKGKNIAQVLDMTVEEALEFFASEQNIVRAMEPLAQVGLGYLTLGQPSTHLSGGEAQRMKLASFLSRGSTAGHVLFIFDEPTTGLHFHDIHLLMDAFNRLVEAGHSVLIIEHNLEVIKSADWIVDLGPEGGEGGGQLVFQGFPEGLIHVEDSYTAQYLRGKV